jgi:hypothetical protein
VDDAASLLWTAYAEELVSRQRQLDQWSVAGLFSLLATAEVTTGQKDRG